MRISPTVMDIAFEIKTHALDRFFKLWKFATVNGEDSSVHHSFGRFESRHGFYGGPIAM
jgi:hypothetical protein